jgi:predicted CXXCH cytochrome family protein
LVSSDGKILMHPAKIRASMARKKIPKRAAPATPKKEEQRSSLLSASRLRLLAALLIVVAIAAVVWFFVVHRRTDDTPSVQNARKINASYVDNQTCVECHQKESQEWAGSDHQMAMALPNDQTVRGDFNNSQFGNYGVTSRFFKRDGKFFVNTETGDGSLADFEIKYTFGIRPLQQYLIEFPGGRLQALGTAWDTNKRNWFHIYANERIKPDDPLHWTRLYQNWNLMCADCHSTNLKKNYDPQTETYKTTWDVINVSCQSCHGPGSAHVEWARRHEPRTSNKSEAIGLVVNLKSGDPHDQVAACLPCHTRRARLTADDWAGRPLLDTFLPALLTQALYYADGQILEEDYEYGSFLQTKMYQDGVRCVDCHDAHTLKKKAEGNALCVQCHSERADRRFPKLIPKVYDTPAHHFHKPDSPGALCVNCHMPAKNYMVVDPRRDHSFRIPRPDLSVKIGTPNACNACHKEKTPQWATDAVAKWYGPNRRQEPHYGEVIAAARARKPEAASQLIALVRDKNIPAIVRATALELLRSYGPEANQTMIDATKDPDPLVRVTAVDGLDRLTPDEKLSVVTPLLRDPIRAVRIQAARVLTGAPIDRLESTRRQEFESALAEYRLAQIYNADIPSGNLNLALIETSLKQFDSAVEHYKIAIRLDPEFMPARVNLGNLYNQLGRNADAETQFREAIAHAPNNGDLHYSLGLLLAEEKRLNESAEELGKAAKLMPDRPRVQYNYALALQQAGKMKEAEAVWLRAYQLDSQDPDVVNALVLFYAQQEKWDQALPYAQALVRLTPGAPEPLQMLKRIEAERFQRRSR